MAEHGGTAPNQQPPEQPIEAADDDRAQQLCLDFGRVLMLGGVLVAIPFPAAANMVHTTRAFVGFVLWILGAWLCLLGLTPAAPWAVRVGAAIASYVLKFLSLL